MQTKITVGFVAQKFNDDGECVAQEFIAGDQVDWENEYGEAIEPKDFYHPLEMVQPIPPHVKEFFEVFHNWVNSEVGNAFTEDFGYISKNEKEQLCYIGSYTDDTVYVVAPLEENGKLRFSISSASDALYLLGDDTNVNFVKNADDFMEILDTVNEEWAEQKTRIFASKQNVNQVSPSM